MPRGPGLLPLRKSNLALRKSLLALRKSQMALRKSHLALRKLHLALRKSHSSLRKSRSRPGARPQPFLPRGGGGAGPPPAPPPGPPPGGGGGGGGGCSWLPPHFPSPSQSHPTLLHPHPLLNQCHNRVGPVVPHLSEPFASMEFDSSGGAGRTRRPTAVA
jgi:hypothetical protein